MNSHQVNRILLRALIGALSLINGLSAQTISLGPYETLPGSRLWMDGKTNINKFSCETELLTGYAYFGSEDIFLPVNNFQNVETNTSLYFFIPIRSFDCRNDRMNKDMYKALKENQYPIIEYELTKSELIEAPTAEGVWYSINTTGNLTLAGTTKKIEMAVKVRPLSNNTFQITGFISISMRDFNIKPPTAFFGLIKAKPELSISFDIYAEAKQTAGTINHFNIAGYQLESSNQILSQFLESKCFDKLNE